MSLNPPAPENDATNSTPQQPYVPSEAPQGNYPPPPQPNQYLAPPQYTSNSQFAGSSNVSGGSIMQTAKFGMYGLIATGVAILISILQLPFGPIFSIGGLVLAIMSLVKKETPKWPAWVTIGLSIVGLVLFAIALVLIIGGVALIAVNS